VDELINGIVAYVTRMLEKQSRLMLITGLLVTIYTDNTADIKFNNVTYGKVPILNRITTLSNGDSIKILGNKTNIGYTDMIILGKI
jgi:hypothetical protein